MIKKVALSVLLAVLAVIAACSGGGTKSGPMGMAAIVIRDGTVQSSDGRTVTSVFVEISQITIRMDDDADDDDDEHEDGDHHAMNEDGDDDDGHHGDGDDDDDDHDDDDEIEIVVFDMFRDNGGVPREFDLLTLTDSGVLLNMRRIPAGSYDRARVQLVGATALFEDDTTQTPVTLLLGSDVMKVSFQPPVEVTETGTTVVAIDIVPVLTFDGTNYTLSNDTSSDHSGNCGDGELEIEVEGTVSSVAGDELHLVNFPLVIDLSQIGPVMLFPGMEVEVAGFMDDGVMVAERLEIED